MIQITLADKFGLSIWIRYDIVFIELSLELCFIDLFVCLETYTYLAAETFISFLEFRFYDGSIEEILFFNCYF